MNASSRSVLFVGPLVFGLLASACSEGPTASQLPSALSVTGPSSLSLIATNTTWRLQSLTATGSPEVTITDPAAFTLLLTDDGKLQARADCNRASAGYAVADQTLALGLIASTMAQCASAPIDGQFLSLLGGDHLVATSDTTLQFSSSRGTLRFVR